MKTQKSQSLLLFFVLFFSIQFQSIILLAQNEISELWGMTSEGGANGIGTIFKTNVNGDNLSVVYSFLNEPEGNSPVGKLCLASNGKLYGMTPEGGIYQYGVIFEFDIETNTYTKKYDFNNENGKLPKGSLIEGSNGMLYGVTNSGGTDNNGVIFEYDVENDIYTKKYDLGANDGAGTNGSLFQANNGKLYGMTQWGGEFYSGVLFEFDPISNLFEKKHDFESTNGSYPFGNIIQADNGKLYGMAKEGGTNGYGVIFEYNLQTDIYNVIYNFDGVAGSYPEGDLLQINNGKLYGMTLRGGESDYGVLFEYDLNTSTYTKKHDFNNTTGINPSGSLIQSENGNLYGMTKYGGGNNFGSLFKFNSVTNTIEEKFSFDHENGSIPIGSLIKITKCGNYTVIDTAVCHSYISPTGKTWDTTATYYDTITNVYGCDSIIQINLSVKNTTTIISETACYTYISPSGKFWFESGTYIDTIINAAGCDSIITINLTISDCQYTIQKGQDIDGVTAEDKTGYSVSLSSDGNVLALGAVGTDGDMPYSGNARIYSWNGSEWVQKGNDINGENENDLLGESVSISADGTILAVSVAGHDGNGNNLGQVKVFHWNGLTWEQLGSDIEGKIDNGYFSYPSLELSSDGNVLAIGASEDSTYGYRAGHTIVYEWNGAEWQQKGQHFYGEEEQDVLGGSVSINSNGNVLALYTGRRVKIFNWTDNTWLQKGSDLKAGYNDAFGQSIDIDSSGNNIIVGAPRAGISGRAYVFSWNGEVWIQKGTYLKGESETSSDWFGYKVSISSDGNIIAIGAFLNDGNGSNSGHVRVYKWNGTDWEQIGLDIDGEQVEDRSGDAVSLSPDGSCVAIGATGNDGKGNNSGHVRVYRLCTPTYNIIDTIVCDSYLSPSGKMFFENGIYQDTISNSMDCDSIIIINLTVGVCPPITAFTPTNKKENNILILVLILFISCSFLSNGQKRKYLISLLDKKKEKIPLKSN